MSERVDKKWVDRGIDSYSTEAILGTLGHYGVEMTEARYLELAKTMFPLAIAQEWHDQWKGTGQFSRFPAAAAEELWSRFKKGELAPTDLALTLIGLLGSLDGALSGKADDGTWDSRFKMVEAYIPKIPTEPKTRERFMVETLAAVGDEWSQVFDGMPEALAQKGHPALADRLVSVDEGLFPEHQGVMRAVVKAAKGDKPAAIADLTAIANDTSRIPFARLGAATGLMELGHFDVKAPLIALLDEAEKKRDVDLAGETVEALRSWLEHGKPERKDADELRGRIEQLVQTFNG
ncbi:MAG: hypothetical protein U0228_18360 [Myxococcaceae bacterium]